MGKILFSEGKLKLRHDICCNVFQRTGIVKEMVNV